jgi:hypothetical protein
MTAADVGGFRRDAAKVMALVEQLRASRGTVARLRAQYGRLVDAARPVDRAAIEIPGDVLKIGDTIAWLTDALADAERRLGPP